MALCNLANGGRGIGNIVESHLINPLSRFLFDYNLCERASVTIQDIDVSATPVSLIAEARPMNEQTTEEG